MVQLALLWYLHCIMSLLAYLHSEPQCCISCFFFLLNGSSWPNFHLNTAPLLQGLSATKQPFHKLKSVRTNLHLGMLLKGF